MSVLTEHSGVRFEAPATTFAPSPAEARGLARDEVRLLVARPGGLAHARFRDLPDHLAPGDLVVVNNSATVAGETDARWRDRSVVLHAATTSTTAAGWSSCARGPTPPGPCSTRCRASRW